MNDIKSSITETHERWHRGHIEPFWTDKSYKSLEYKYGNFNNFSDVIKWKKMGYIATEKRFGGALCDFKSKQPDWNQNIMNWFADTFGMKDIGTGYYKMDTDMILPTHSDTYERYRNIFGVELRNCYRVIVYLEDWKPGHVSEIDGVGVTNWKKGDYLFWESDVPHMAANIGLEPRYTLQITGHNA